MRRYCKLCKQYLEHSTFIYAQGHMAKHTKRKIKDPYKSLAVKKLIRTQTTLE